MLYVVASLVLALLAGWWAGVMADRKGRNVRLWMVASVFLILPVLVLALLPPKRRAAEV